MRDESMGEIQNEGYTSFDIYPYRFSQVLVTVYRLFKEAFHYE